MLQTSVSPMISPGNSPHLVRRSATPTSGVVMPPPLPPRKSSPTLEHTQDTSELFSQISKSSSVQDICTDNGGGIHPLL